MSELRVLVEEEKTNSLRTALRCIRNASGWVGGRESFSAFADHTAEDKRGQAANRLVEKQAFSPPSCRSCGRSVVSMTGDQKYDARCAVRHLVPLWLLAFIRLAERES
jgi:hypothetical protein